MTPTASADLRPSDAVDALTRLLSLLEPDMAAVDQLIKARMDSPVGMIPDLADHLVSAGGKRVRPLLTVATARMLGYEGGHHVRLAATVEFIHSATLLHDDVVDGSELRRGKMAANLVWGNAASVLVGDFLFARAFNLMVETESLRVLDILSATSSVIAEGEVRQLAHANDISLSEAEYRDIIGAKTAALFAAAAQVSGVVANVSPDEERDLARYGRELGLAFQLVDDALDYGGSSKALGKAVGDDFREGKVTLPVVLAVASADADERAFWSRVMEERTQEDGDLEHALALLHRHGALSATVDAAHAHAVAAREALSGFAPGPVREALMDLAEFVVVRAY